MAGKKVKQFAATTLIPTIKHSHRYLVVYNTRLVDGELTRGRYENLIIDGEKVQAYSGEMSAGSRKRLQDACELMIAITQKKWYNHPLTGKRLSFRIALITTTLSAPQGGISDREIKKGLLEPLLRKLRKYGLRNYIWKAERQRNGNIHFHIFVDAFIDKTDLRNIWNRLQAKYHFIQAFRTKHGHSDPNSTDIKAVVTEDGLIKYMLKYMIKPVDKAEQKEIGRPDDKKDTGKVWDCSKALKLKNPTAEFCESGEYELIDQGVNLGELKEVRTDYCWIYIFSGDNWRDYIPASISSRYIQWLADAKAMSV